MVLQSPAASARTVQATTLNLCQPIWGCGSISVHPVIGYQRPTLIPEREAEGLF